MLAVNFQRQEDVEIRSIKHLIIITTNDDNIKSIMNVVLLFVFLNSTGYPGKFYVVCKHFQDLKNLMLNILKEKLTSPWLVCSFFIKTHITLLE